jgi:hypothetical protein
VVIVHKRGPARYLRLGLTAFLIVLLAVHVVAWAPALAVTLPRWRLPLMQSMVSLACGVAAWFISRRRHR